MSDCKPNEKPLPSWKELEENLIRFRDLSGLIRIQLYAYVPEINRLIKEISELEFANASGKFNELYAIENQLIKALYEYHFDLPKILYDFVYEFDRDDDASRKYWHEKFKAGYILKY